MSKLVVPPAQKLIAALESLGCHELTGWSRVYRTFRHDTDPDKFFFVGDKGALRCGRTVVESAPAYLDRIRLLAHWTTLQEPV